MQATSQSQREHIAGLEAARDELARRLNSRGTALAGAVRQLFVADFLLRGLPTSPSAKVGAPAKIIYLFQIRMHATFKQVA